MGNTTGATRLILNAGTGNVGIGTTVPAAKLDIAGTTSTISNTSGNITITSAGNTIFSAGNVGIGTISPAAKLDVAGTGRYTCAATWVDQGAYINCADIAEVYQTNESFLETGDILVAAKNGTGKVARSGTAYQKDILGVYSTSPGLLVGGDTVIGGGGTEKLKTNDIPMALAGRAPVKVTSENGPIIQGDLLTSSSLPGVAMKATQAGPIIGKALESYNESDPQKIDKILAFINVSWYDPGTSQNTSQNNHLQILEEKVAVQDKQIEELRRQIEELKKK